MKRRFGRSVLCAAVLLATVQGFANSQAPQAQPGQPPRPFAWWRDAQYQKNLGLTYDQVNRVENIFQAALPELRKGRDELDRHEAELSRLIEMNADEAVVVRQIDKVEAIRSRLDKSRQLLLLHFRQVLTPEQRIKLKEALDRDRGIKPPVDHKQ